MSKIIKKALAILVFIAPSTISIIGLKMYGRDFGLLALEGIKAIKPVWGVLAICFIIELMIIQKVTKWSSAFTALAYSITTLTISVSMLLTSYLIFFHPSPYSGNVALIASSRHL